MRKDLLYFFLFCTACFSSVDLFSQNVGPSFGTVTDSITGKPIPGAAVYIKANQYRVVETDAKGAFIITVYRPPQILVISAKGYITNEVAVLNNKDRLNVMLRPVAQQKKLRKKKK